MKPKEAIREALREYVVPRLARLDFSFSDWSLDFKRKNGQFVQKINTHLERWNAEDVCAEFYFSFSVNSNFYVRWHQKEYGTRSANDFLASEMYWNLSGWKNPRPNVASKENAEREMLLLLKDTLELGLPFLERHSSWENAAVRFVENRWFHDKACDFYLIAGNPEMAHWCLEQALEDWKKQPNRSFFVGEKEGIKLRFQKYFGETPPIG